MMHLSRRCKAPARGRGPGFAGGCLIALAMLTACGQRGPLYLPADKQPKQNVLRIEESIEYDTRGREQSADDAAQNPKKTR